MSKNNKKKIRFDCKECKEIDNCLCTICDTKDCENCRSLPGCAIEEDPVSQLSFDEIFTSDDNLEQGTKVAQADHKKKAHGNSAEVARELIVFDKTSAEYVNDERKAESTDERTAEAEPTRVDCEECDAALGAVAINLIDVRPETEDKTHKKESKQDNGKKDNVDINDKLVEKSVMAELSAEQIDKIVNAVVRAVADKLSENRRGSDESSSVTQKQLDTLNERAENNSRIIDGIANNVQKSDDLIGSFEKQSIAKLDELHRSADKNDLSLAELDKKANEGNAAIAELDKKASDGYAAIQELNKRVEEDSVSGAERHKDIEERLEKIGVAGAAVGEQALRIADAVNLNANKLDDLNGETARATKLLAELAEVKDSVARENTLKEQGEILGMLISESIKEQG
ncbi:MAG: hypothetical protein PHD46_07715, partial [Eubacteriales bacterium]|nr:hypothetical protein [Eubacteriales bacterium]